MNLNVFNLISEVNQTKFLVQHELCECKCGLNESVCNTKQNGNCDECRSECKYLDDWGSCEKDYIWNPSICNCECNKDVELLNI